jgi:hypothetical protein
MRNIGTTFVPGQGVITNIAANRTVPGYGAPAPGYGTGAMGAMGAYPPAPGYGTGAMGAMGAYPPAPAPGYGTGAMPGYTPMPTPVIQTYPGTPIPVGTFPAPVYPLLDQQYRVISYIAYGSSYPQGTFMDLTRPMFPQSIRRYGGKRKTLRRKSKSRKQTRRHRHSKK